MLLVFVAYLGGVLTILSPCILPVLPFVFARADRPFRSHGLPMLVGMAAAFAVVATLAAVGGAWVVEAHRYGRALALLLLALFGLALVIPRWAERLGRPLVDLGQRIAATPPDRPRAHRGQAVLLGIGTGLLWAPCAGPILGLVLTGAALNGASVGSAVLLLAYACGAATSLAGALLAGRRTFAAMRTSWRLGQGLQRLAGVAVLASVGAIASGLDTGALSRLSLGSTISWENALLGRLAGSAVSNAGPGGGAETQRQFVALAASTVPAIQFASRSEPLMPELHGATEWINSAPLGRDQLRGKVVLIDFWTYSCINCLRTLPYLRAWHAKYQAAGLVVIGVHTPEFAFERLPANVRRATRDLHVDFPVAVDSQYALWRAFNNRYWPAFYFIDAQGYIRHQQFGEGQYEKSEEVIQQLLAEAGRARVPNGLVAPRGEGVQAAAETAFGQSPETYVGHAQASRFSSPGGIARDRAQRYRVPPSLPRDHWALEGDWAVHSDSAALLRPGGRIVFRFRARDLHLVLGPAEGGRPVRFKVRIDGKPPLSDHGADIDEQGSGTIDGVRLYQLVRQASRTGERVFEIEFLDEGAQAYAFTFG